MLSSFPVVRQPDNFGCLPTCVVAVLRYYKENVSYEEVCAWCEETSLWRRELPEGGIEWLDAIDALKTQGYEIQEIDDGDAAGEIALQTLRHVVTTEQLPIVAEIEIQSYQPGHAVVVIGFEQVSPEAGTGETVHFMDPAREEIVSAPTEDFCKKWQFRGLKAFCILHK